MQDSTNNTTVRTLGRYQLLRRVGRGGMGEVWLCDDPRLRRQVAIKTLPPHNQNDEEFSARFEREAQAAAALSHPHILPVHDYGEHMLASGQVITYIVMPYLEGGSLADRINKLAANRQGMAQEEALNYLTQAAEAIDYAHSQGVVHRDIKPANMLLRNDNWLMLADFGIARIMSNQDSLTQAGTGIGTPEYMAPEQARGHAVGASDNYSLAVIAYQLFTGRPPFSAETSYATTIQHLTLTPPPPRQFNPNIPPGCEEALLRGLAKEPVKRYPSARAFIDAIKQSLGNPFPQAALATMPGGGTSQPGMMTLTPGSEVQPLVARSLDSQPSLVQGENRLQPQVVNNVTRRNLLLGGAAALVVVGGGISTWAYLNRRALFPTPAKPTPTHVALTPTPTPNPDGPTLVLRDHNSVANTLAWAPKQNILYSGADDGTIKLWNIDQLQQQKKDEYSSTSSHDFRGVTKILAWSHDGQFLAIGNSRLTDNFDTTVIDVYKADLSAPVAGLEKGFVAPTISVDGLTWYKNKYLVSVWYDVKRDNIFLLGVWDMTHANPQPQPITIPGSISLNVGGPTRDVIASPDGSRLAISSYDGVYVGKLDIQGTSVKWTAEPFSPLKNKKGEAFGNQVDTMTWSSTGNSILSAIEDGAPGNKVVGWNLKNNPSDPIIFGMPSASTNIQALAIYPTQDKALLAGGAKDGSIYIWDGNQNNIPARILNSGGIKAEILVLAWSSDGQWLAASYKDNNATILVWRI